MGSITNENLFDCTSCCISNPHLNSVLNRQATMWSTSNNNRNRRAANVKGYLGGGFATVNEEQEHHQPTDDASVANMSSGDVSSLGGISALSTDFHTSSPSHPYSSSGSKPPSVLVEIPENFPRELDAVRSPQHSPAASRRSPNSILDIDGESVSVATANLVIDKMKQRFQERAAAAKDDSAAMMEIEKNLDDMDNYLLSIYMNDDASIYTKATNSDASSSFSSNSSVSSSYSTRSRHRGAHRNRRRAGKQHSKSKSSSGSWIESMKESSQNVLVGDGGWTPLKGWNISAPKKTWDAQPDDRWNEGLNVFDSVKKERVEI